MSLAAELLEEVEVHAPGCRCPVCQCRRWLAYASPDRQAEVLKIATYGGTGGGSGEPDRAYDRVVTEVDMERALGMVREPFLRLVGGLHRNLRGERDSRTLAWFRGPLPVIRWLERFEADRWTRECEADAEPGWETVRDLWRMTAHQTLRRLLDECAVEMARNLGAVVEGQVRTASGRSVPKAPVEG